MGIWCDCDGFGLYFKVKGVVKVIFIVLGKGDIKNIVYGVNDEEVILEDIIVFVVSCIINVIMLVFKVLDEEYGIENGYVEIVYFYIND